MPIAEESAMTMGKVYKAEYCTLQSVDCAPGIVDANWGRYDILLITAIHVKEGSLEADF